MTASAETDKEAYKYNVLPVIKPEYFGKPFWRLVQNAEDVKADYDWRGNEIVICTHPRSATTYPCMGWYNHVKAWEEYAHRNPDAPIKFQMYEDLVRKSKECIARMAKFLDIDVTDEFLNEVAEASKFTNMRKTKVDTFTDDAFHGDGHSALYRKGIIGEWKNRLTGQNNELFQKVFPELSSDIACKDKLTFI